MKKRLICGALALILALGGFLTAHALVLGSGERITFEEKTRQGDFQAAQGLRMDTELTSLRNNLRWNTAMTMGQEPETHMKYLLFGSGDAPVEEKATLKLNNYLNFGITSYGGGVDLNDSMVRGVRTMVEDVAGRTPNGEWRVERVNLRDYYEFLPLELELYIPGHMIKDDVLEVKEEASFRQDFENAFRFPVPEEYTRYVTVKKDENGKLMEVHVDQYPVELDGEPGEAPSAQAADEEVRVEVRSVNDEHYLYFVVEAERCFYGEPDTKTEVCDYSHTPGYGVYRLPLLPRNSEDDRPLTMDDLELICPMEVEKPLVSLDVDGEHLMAVTKEEAAYVLHVLNSADGAEVQTLILDKVPESTGGYSEVRPFFYQDFVVYLCMEDPSYRLTVLSRNGDGSLLPEYGADIPVELVNGSLSEGGMLTFAYDGEKLAMGQLVENGGYTGGSVRLAVFGPEGLRYNGLLESSMDRSIGMKDKTAHDLDYRPGLRARGILQLNWA